MAQFNRISLVSLLALGIAMPAFGQQTESGPQTAPQAGDEGAGAGGRDVVVITANKRQESIQDVAVAVTAITSEDKQEKGIITITDLTNVTPGLAYTPANERVSLRGIGRLTNSIGADPGVANYNDGFYTSFAVTAGKDPLFIERVEVLRGPQGTLYGRNAIGGAINTISKRPTDDFTADFTLGVGNYGYRNTAAAVSGPINDWLRYRVAGQVAQREGVDLNYGTGKHEGWEIDNYYYEGQLEGDIGERFSWWLKVGDSGYHGLAGPPGGATSTFSAEPYLPQFNLNGTTLPNNGFAYSGSPDIISVTQLGSRTDNPFATNGEHAYNSNRGAEADLNAWDEYIFEGVYSTDWFDIKYTGGYNYFDYTRTFDNDGTPVQSITYNAITSRNPVAGCDVGAFLGAANAASQLRGLPVNTFGPTYAAGCVTGTAVKTIHPTLTNSYGESRAFFSNEINLISTVEGPLQWLAGLYHYQDNNNQPGLDLRMPEEPGVSSYFNPLTGTVIANPDRTVIFTGNKSLFNAYGAYGQIDYELNDQLKFTLGLRYSKDLKESEEKVFLGCFIVCSTANLTGNPATPFFSPTDFVNLSAIQFNSALGATQATNGYTTTSDSRGWLVRRLRGSYDAVTGTAGVEYRPMADTLTFLKYSRGYKAGGFNNLALFTGAPYTNPEFVDSYEAGWKQTWAELGLTTNASLFYYNYTDAQAPLRAIVRDPNTGIETTQTVFYNLPEVETTGFELESNWNPIDPLNIGLTYAYLNAEVTNGGTLVDPTRDNRCVGATPGSRVTCNATFTTLVDPLSVRSINGNTLSQSPKNKVALFASYKLDMEDGSYWLPTVTYTWRDKFYDSFFNNPNELAPAYENIDARLNWKSADGVLGLTFWVRNLTDQDQNTQLSADNFRRETLTSAQTASFTLPRTWGVDLLVHY